MRTSHARSALARLTAVLLALPAIMALGSPPAGSAGAPVIGLVNDTVVIHKTSSCALPSARRASPAPAASRASDPETLIPGRVIVRLRPAIAESPEAPAEGEAAEEGRAAKGSASPLRDADGCLLTGVRALDSVSHSLSIRTVTALFARRTRSTLSDVRLIRYASGMSPLEAAALLRKDPDILWAEPDRFRKVEAIPTDSTYGAQYALPLINAERAWDITTGDPSAIIAVIDTGLDRAHLDLVSNVWKNDPEVAGAAGVDDDGNGFVDDHFGWDFVDVDPFYAAPGEDAVTQDNDPIDFAGHGTNVAGVAAAAANNLPGMLGLNIAGVCWTCRVMGLRAGFLGSSGFGLVVESAWTEALVYAADNGARVANLSFGGTGSSLIGDEALAYALERGMLIVAAAGNANNSASGYPASYPGVVAVAATDQTDRKTVFSSYGSWVTLAAPGVSILTTAISNSYIYVSGTSFSAPYVAGAAGLLFSHRPLISGEEAADLLISGAVDIDALNPLYAGELGAGRLDVYRALTGYRIGVTNSGGAALNVTGVSIDPAAPWLSVSTQLPVGVPPGGTGFLDLVIDADQAPCGRSTVGADVASDDPARPLTPVQIAVSVDCDADNDGHDCPDRGGDDCDDGNAAEHPGAPEICEGPAACDGVTGADEDCDGRVDEICSCSGKPNAPEVLPPVSISTSEKAAVRVTWIDLADNEKGFRIYRRHGGAPWKHIADVGRDVLSYDDTRVQSATDYTYALRAYNGKGSSARVQSYYSVFP